MSNDIRIGKPPISLTSNESHQGKKVTASQSDSGKAGAAARVGDTVSVTAAASRLQEIESMLAAIPTVNNGLVSEISQMIADGSLEIDLDRTAARLIETETGVTDPNKQ